MLYYFEYNNLLSDTQFGFRPGRSTSDNLSIINSIQSTNSQQRRATLIVTRDVYKAFDTLWHQGLLYKLHHFYNFNLTSLAIIYNYLVNRSLTPRFNYCAGPPITPKAGVPKAPAWVLYYLPSTLTIFLNRCIEIV